MAREFLLLGRLMAPALQRARQRALRRVGPAVAGNVLRRTLVTLFADAWLEGSHTAILAHGARLGLTRRGIEARTSVGLTDRLVTAVRARVDRLLDAAEDVSTVQQLTQWAATANEGAVWSGQDEEAQVIARLAEVEWKTWVRAFARDEARDHHDDLNGVTIPVTDRFVLNGVSIYGPRDWDALPDPSEWMNCGHALDFSREVTREELGDTFRHRDQVVIGPERVSLTPRELRARGGR
jgi:hypothetical protein